MREENEKVTSAAESERPEKPYGDSLPEPFRLTRLLAGNPAAVSATGDVTCRGCRRLHEKKGR